MRNAFGRLACLLFLLAPASAQDSPESIRLGRPVAGDLPVRWVGDSASMEGHVTLLRWWTDGCPHCALSLPAIETLRVRYAARGLVTVGVFHPKPVRSVTGEEVARAAERLGFRGPIAIDEDWSWLRRIWLDTGERSATSASFLLDPEGRIRFVHPGPELHPSADADHGACAEGYRQLVEAIEAELARAHPAPVDTAGLLAELADRRSLARLPTPSYRVLGDASTDGSPVELHGPGAVVRLVSDSPSAAFRIHVDLAETPVLGVAERGVLLPPVPFAKSCRISAEPDGTAPFQVEYRSYAEGTTVEPLTADSVAALAPAIEAARKRLSHPGQGADALGATTFTYSLSEEIPEGALLCVDLGNASGPRAITELHLRAEATELVPALRRAVLRISFDGEETVACPLGDFFAVFGEVEPFESAPMRVAPGADEAIGHPGSQVELVCRFVMPYRESFNIVIDARHAGDLHVAGSIRTEPWDWDGRSMYFHASWRCREGGNGGAAEPWVRLFVEGRGLYVGEAISAQGVERRFRTLDAQPFDLRLALESGAMDRAATSYSDARPGAHDTAPPVDVASRPPR